MPTAERLRGALAQLIWSQRRFLIAIVTVAIVVGAVQATRLPVALFPAVHFPRILVEIDCGDRPPERMALDVTLPSEEALRGLPGVTTLRSTTSRGETEISITFDWRQDMDHVLALAQATVDQLSLPASSTTTVRRMDPTVFPCLACSMVSNQRPLDELRRIAIRRLRPMLASIPGVALVEVQGGEVDELHAVIDPARLRAAGLSARELSDAIAAANIEASVGRIEDGGRLVLVTVDAQTHTADELRRIPLRTGASGILRLGDVADPLPSSAPQYTRIAADDHPAVSLQIYQQPGGNTIAIAQAVRERLASAGDQLPGDVHLAVWYDQSQLILAAFHSVRLALWLGIGLAGIVLLIGLQSWRMTVVALVAVPASLAMAVLAMAALHLDFNIMTLGGMAAAVGLVIDDAIVVAERAIAHARAGRILDRIEHLQQALTVAGPLAASSAATLVIFAPLAFLTGVSGAFFQSLALTMAASLVSSFLIALTVVPLMTSVLVGRAEVEPRRIDAVWRQLGSMYAAAMRRLAQLWWLALPLLILPLVLLGWRAYHQLGTGFLPTMDEGGFVIDYRAPPGTSLSETNRLTAQIESLLRATPEVASWSRRTGAQLGNGLTEANEGDFFVRLRGPPRASAQQVMDRLRARIARGVAGLQVEMAQLMEDLIGDLLADPHPIEVILSGDDPDALAMGAHQVAEHIAAVPGVVDVHDGVVVAGDTLTIAIDRDRAAALGLDATEATRQVQVLLGQTVAATVQNGIMLSDIRASLAPGMRQSPEQLLRLPLQGRDGQPCTLGEVAHLSAVAGAREIHHVDLQRVVAVTANLAGRDLGSAIAEVERALPADWLASHGVHASLGGLYHEQQVAFTDLGEVLMAAIVLVFLLLLVVYRSLRVALAMLATALLSLCGVLIGLALCRMQLNISSLMGMTMVVGIVTEVAILYVSAIRPASDGSEPLERLLEASRARSRPIAMTVCAAILALSPLALGMGAGADMQQPLAAAIIAGLVVQLPLCLIVLPLLLHALRAPRDHARQPTLA